MGVMIRALDIGSYHPQAAHTQEYLFPSLIASLELREDKISGKELILAYALGSELADRVGDVCLTVYTGRNPCLGQLGATAAVARVLGLDTQKIWNAIGIDYGAFNSLDITMYYEPNLMERVHHSFTCQTSVNLQPSNHVLIYWPNVGIKQYFSEKL